MERMMRNMESTTVKKVVLKRVAMMTMMTMMLPVRKAIKNDAVWPLQHPVMHDALRQCQAVKLLTIRITQCQKYPDSLGQTLSFICCAWQERLRRCTTPRLHCTESKSQQLLHERESSVLLQT